MQAEAKKLTKQDPMLVIYFHGWLNCHDGFENAIIL